MPTGDSGKKEVSTEHMRRTGSPACQAEVLNPLIPQRSIPQHSGRAPQHTPRSQSCTRSDLVEHLEPARSNKGGSAVIARSVEAEASASPDGIAVCARSVEAEASVGTGGNAVIARSVEGSAWEGAAVRVGLVTIMYSSIRRARVTCPCLARACTAVFSGTRPNSNPSSSNLSSRSSAFCNSPALE